MAGTCKHKRSKGMDLITCSRPATKDGYCTRHHPAYVSPSQKAAEERLDKLRPFLVRVTRSTDQEYADIEVKAVDAEEAKLLATKEAQDREDYYFGSTPKPEFYVDPMDEPEEVEGD